MHGGLRHVHGKDNPSLSILSICSQGSKCEAPLLMSLQCMFMQRGGGRDAGVEG